MDYQHQHGHPELTAYFHISHSHPFLGALPDGGVYDPSSVNEPYGFVEIKCPYSHRDETAEPVIANLSQLLLPGPRADGCGFQDMVWLCHVHKERF